jgi:hypothetical protein
MGLTRKLLSVSTLGAVDYRSDKERTAAYTKATAKEAKEQTALMRQTAAQHAATPQPQPPAAPPAGWYPDPNGLPCQRWWDGTQWTVHTS